MIISGTTLVGGTYGTSPIVQTGLMQWYDAQSYTTGGMWPAKTGYDAQLVNSPTYNSSSPTYFNFNTQSSLQFAFTNNIGDLTNWTIESWFRPQADLTADGNEGLKTILTTVYNDELSGFTGQINYCFTNYNGSGGALNAISVGFFNGQWHLTSPISVTTGVWYYMAGTYDGTTMSQYYNGSINSSVGASGPSIANNGRILIGRRWDGNINPIYLFPGDISIIRIYNTALNDTQIAQNFNAERGRFGL